MFTSYQLMFHGTNTQKLPLSGHKRQLEKEQQVHTYSCVNTSRHKSVLPPYQLWLCSGAGRCQRFPQNNVTRRGIPVRARKSERGGRGGGGGPAQTEQARWRHLNRLWHPPGVPSLALPPALCLCRRGRNFMWPANCWLPNSSLTGWRGSEVFTMFYFFYAQLTSYSFSFCSFSIMRLQLNSLLSVVLSAFRRVLKSFTRHLMCFLDLTDLILGKVLACYLCLNNI